jgi:hypothetical protein
MRPWEIARSQWDKECSNEGSFEQQMSFHFAGGVVISTPDLFALVHDEGDGWFVTSAAATKPGWLAKLMQFMDRREFIRFRRNGGQKTKVYRWEQLARRRA